MKARKAPNETKEAGDVQFEKNGNRQCAYDNVFYTRTWRASCKKPEEYDSFLFK